MSLSHEYIESNAKQLNKKILKEIKSPHEKEKGGRSRRGRTF